MPFFSRVFRSKDSGGATSKSKKQIPQNGAVQAPLPKPRWDDAWLRKDVEPEEVQELLRGCTNELKSRALDMPFLLLPFRPASDPSAARSFIRNYFNADRGIQLQGEGLEQELRLTEPMVLCSVMKWCWSRLPGGVVTWEAYELFRIGEQDSDLARDAFATFIPISIESDARTKIIFDFFDLMAAIAAHGKTNGMGGRKLSRLAGWWAFEQVDGGNGFDGGYKSWASAADATSHLFFAYLRSLSPDSVRGTNGISALPISLQTLVEATEYPPEQQTLSAISKVVMIVDSVSPTPFALLRRANHFEYRDEDHALQEFSDYEDPVQALTDECRRVLKSISSTNQSTVSTSKASTSLRDASWSRFEDLGFGGLADDSDDDDGSALGKQRKVPQGMRSAPESKSHTLGDRPMTPSWADFLSSGFVDEPGESKPAQLQLPHDKMLPPIDTRRGQSSQSHRRPRIDSNLEPGELASINAMRFDDAFWWVWISSLAGEEPTERKGVFGRCALIETNIRGGKWLVLEEMVKGAAPEPEMGAYIAEKKSRFGFSKRSRLNRTKTVAKKGPPPLKTEPYMRSGQPSPMSKTSIGTDQHARIQAAAAALQQKHREMNNTSPRRGRMGDAVSTKTNSVFTLQPVIMSEAAPAMKWASSYDKKAVRAAYLGNDFTGRGSTVNLESNGANNVASTNGSITPTARPEPAQKNESYGFPQQGTGPNVSGAHPMERQLPSLPPVTPQAEVSKPSYQQPTPVPPPAPLPVAPLQDMHPSNRAVSEAAEVPLPATTPYEYQRPVENQHPIENQRPFENKPLPPIEPAYEQESTAPLPTLSRETTQQQNGAISTSSSPESKKTASKLKKGDNRGLKGFFGKKKPGFIAPVPARAADSSAVAAARAAYEGPQMKPNYRAPTQSSTLSRRLSGLGGKKAPIPMPITAQPAVTTPEPRQPSPIEQSNHIYSSQANLSHVDSNEQRHADHEFQSFDQGPLTDQPAFVPEQGPLMDQPAFVPEASVEQRSGLSTPVQRHYEHDDISESDEEGAPSPVIQDRWAQIRKNAAERAARQSEEKAPVQAERADESESETIGEETIESRVARIKARVAELTGNMDGANTGRQ